MLALSEPGIKDFESDDYKVRFYACPCPTKHGKEHMIGWVGEGEKSQDTLHSGIAHGNVEGLGLDADQRYFNMAESDFRNAGLNTLLLGHIHVPTPAPRTTGKPLYFMPGIHIPDSVKCSHPDHAWWIELGTRSDHWPKARHEILSYLSEIPQPSLRRRDRPIPRCPTHILGKSDSTPRRVSPYSHKTNAHAIRPAPRDLQHYRDK